MAQGIFKNPQERKIKISEGLKKAYQFSFNLLRLTETEINNNKFKEKLVWQT